MPSKNESMSELNFLDSKWKSKFRRQIKKWYEPRRRELPWRNSDDPYAVWISEIMLQQTTVAAVVPYFERFIKKFPSVQSLSKGKEEDVLRLWEGLGYYSRARNIHKAAKEIMQRFQGIVPDNPGALQSLPGIGRYTAGAITSFAFGKKAPIVEANTLRLYSRIIGYTADPRSSYGQKVLWEFAEDVLPKENAGHFNQGMMDLGQLICRPDKPLCDECPISKSCFAFEKGIQETVPQRKKRPVITELVDVAVAIRKGTKYLFRLRTEKERWAGLWDFPRWNLEDADPKRFSTLIKKNKSTNQESALFPLAPFDPEEVEQMESELRDQTGIDSKIKTILSVFQHSVTRYRITLVCIIAEVSAGSPNSEETELQWSDPQEWGELPLSMTGRKFAKLLEDSLANEE